MRKTFLTIIGLSAAIALGATTASAEAASSASCSQARDKVAEALSKDTSANHDAAVKESNYGRDFCNNGLYKQGLEHYAQAMKLLGIS